MTSGGGLGEAGAQGAAQGKAGLGYVLEKMRAISHDWALDPEFPGAYREAAKSLHAMAVDLNATAMPSENDLNVAAILFRTLCQKRYGEACGCRIVNLQACVRLNA
jgi:hypothetical protein